MQKQMGKGMWFSIRNFFFSEGNGLHSMTKGITGGLTIKCSLNLFVLKLASHIWHRNLLTPALSNYDILSLLW